MRPGDEVDGRFTLEALAGAGGMGEVFRAVDRLSGALVALKVVRGKHTDDAQRFLREVRILAELDHPNIVRYVSHGVTVAEEPYLAMEWLAGHDLAARLTEGPLTLADTIDIGVAVAEALGFAHARGFVHRDLKPSNVFLNGGDIRQVKLLDFGIARFGAATRMTRTGMLIGTPGYMAPEQANGAAAVDARADVFSLGCLLFECLVGEPVFGGTQLMAILTKILLEEAPRLIERQPGAPPALDALLSRMLAKAPADRPSDGQAVAAALRTLGGAAGQSGARTQTTSPRAPTALGGGERRAVAVILAGGSLEGESIRSADTIDLASEQAFQAEAERHGGRYERLIDGSAAILMTGVSLATDLAAQAARAALSLRAQAKSRSISVAIGRGEVTGRFAVGQAIDRAARLVSSELGGFDGPPVRLDDITAGLLDARFDVRESDAGFVLLGERELGEGARTLLGKATPCVGRERELRILEELFDQCMEERQAQAVVITAPAGVGKSRLSYEFLRHVEAQRLDVALWIARGDPLRAHSPLGLLAQAIRGACELRDGEPLDVRRANLFERTAQLVGPARAQHVSEFLGEIVGVHFDEEASPPLKAARRDAQLMGAQIQEAFLHFLRGACARSPVLIMLEDLHWGDRPTAQLLDVALRDLSGEPLFLLALARPEIEETFPRLWRERATHDIRLRELGRRGIERLARHALGDGIGPETLERFARLSEGNAFYLEELIRWSAEGRIGELPATVVAMVQSRLSTQDDESRRLLRAASVFGEATWTGAMTTLLGDAAGAISLRDRLGRLVDKELFVRRKSRFEGEEEYAFRHALLREGAYAMLTEEDRSLGHRLAGEWLEGHGEDALVLAEHFEKGGDGERAGRHYLRAAEQANGAADSIAAIAHAKRGFSCDVSDELRKTLLGLYCEAHYYSLDAVVDALPDAEKLIEMAAPGSAPWSQGMLTMLVGSMQAGKIERFYAMLARLWEIEVSPEAVLTATLARISGIFLLDIMGKVSEANAMAAQLEGMKNVDRYMANIIVAARSAYALEDPFGAARRGEEARRSASAVMTQRYVDSAHFLTLVNRWFLGVYEETIQAFRTSRLRDEEMGLGSSIRPFAMAWMLAERGEFEEALAWGKRLVESSKSRRLSVDEGRGHWALAEVQRRAGALVEADVEMEAARRILSAVSPLDHPGALASLAALRLTQGRASEALEAAEGALARYESMGACAMFRGAYLRLVHAECLEAVGRRDDARAAIREAKGRIITNAEKISDAAYRQSFLDNVPENRRTFALAEAWAAPRPGE